VNGPLILGLGNTLCSDDGVGPELAARVAALLPGAELRQEAVGGIDLMEILMGHERAVVIDAIRTEGGRVGELYEVELEGLEWPLPNGSTHAFGLLEALELGRRLGLDMPRWLEVYAVEVADPLTVHEGLGPELEVALPVLAMRIAMEVLGAVGGEHQVGR
jgi:hydrogenase maturation protease